MCFRQSIVHTLQFSFDNEDQTVAMRDYISFTAPDRVNAFTIQSAGEYILLLTDGSLIKHDFKTGSQVVSNLTEELTEFKVGGMGSSSILVVYD